MTFTIEQLEALKVGADYAPWRPEYDGGEDHWVIAFDHPKFGGRWDKGIAHGEGAAKLFAASPELLDQLIATEAKLQQLKEMMEGEHAFETVTRLTVVGGSSRILETWGITNVVMSLQDDGRTLKIFYREGTND